LLDTLDELKLADHTIIVFFSDNGGVNWFEPKMKESEMDCPPTSNAPLRAGKGTLYDGGTREPCALIWPGRIKAGTKSDALFCSVDFFPTLLEMAGLKAKPDLKFDGVSQVSTLLGGNAARDTVFCYYPHYSPPGHVVKTMPGVWVRRGDWKLIRFFNDADDQSDRFELYNLRDDIGETRNLAAESRSKVEELDAIIDRHLRETNALVPGKNPIYNPLAPDFTPSKDATVSLAGGTLVITSTGSNPSISVRDLPKGQGPFTIGLRMKSNGKGDARFFWAANPQEPMNRERAVAFPVQHDGEWHNYSVKLPVETSIGVLRFDPGTAPGEARLEFLRLRDKNDKPVREWSFRGDDYAPGPDSQRQDRVPVGKSFQFKIENSKIFPGTSRTIMVYVPAQYKTDKPACVYVGLDGLGFGVPVVFDNLIHQGEMPVTIAIGVTPGSGAPANGAQNPRFNRSFEFDGLNDNLARFLIEEVLPEVEKHQTPDGLPIHLSKDPNDRCTGGASTGAIGAFTLAWERPDAFRRVFTSVGTFVGMRGGDRYPVLVRKTEPKPLRIFMQDGSNDEWMGGPEVGDWWMANQTMERALEFAGYQVEHVWGTGPHGGKHATAIFPDAMRWLWKDWPQPITSGATQNHVLAAILEPGAEWQLVPNADQSPGSLAAHPNGDVFFYDTASHKVFRITSGGKGIESSAANGNLTAIAFNSEGRLYAADANEAKILAFDAEGKASTIADGICARSLTITHDGNLYATESGDGEAAGRVWLIKANGGKSLLDNGLHHPSGVAPSPDGLWLAVAESKTHWGYSYRVQPDGTVQDKQQFYWFHVPDWADDSGAGSLAMDRSGQMYAATRFGVEVFDRNGRVRAILPGPGGAVTALCFGGTNFDTLFVVSGGRIYQRKFKIPGAPPWSAPVQLPPWGAG
jgi:sugar lactone lactonase YvrE/enterochelin esterase-like enzyme